MVKIILLILLLTISLSAQTELTSSKEYLNIDDIEYCIIELNIRNFSDSNVVIYTNNWRLSYISEHSEKYLGFPVIPNLVNRIIVHPSNFNIEKQYLGEDSNLGILMMESIKCLKPSDKITISIVLQDSSTIKLIKDTTYEITYIYSYAFLSDIKSSLKLDDCSNKFHNYIIPLQPIDPRHVKHNIIEDGNLGNMKINYELNSKFKKCLSKI